MKAACILVLAVALASGGGAAFLIGSDQEKKPEAPAVARVETSWVLIAKSDIGTGTAITSQDLKLGTLSLAFRGLLDASKVSEEEERKTDINTVLFGVSNKR
jgi:Flp pilus assembly protein CpaB